MTSWSALVVDDDAGIRQSLRLCLEADGARVLGVGTAPAALEALDRARFDLVLLDLWLGKESGLEAIPELLKRQPDLAIIVVTAFATFESAVEAMKRGASDYLPKPFTPDQVRAATRRALESLRLRQRLADAEHQLEQAGATDERFDGESPAFRSLLKHATKAAAADAPVLVRGESGTGKTALARWLWKHSTRKDGPLITATAATVDDPRKLEQANGGTLFIDEVGDLTPEGQSAVLRFLDERADVRLIVATSHNLEDDVRAGKFREDLLFRLNVVTLQLPPLRERAEDVLALAHHFLARTAARQRRPVFELAESARRAIGTYTWPGNLRELRNAIERAVISSPGPRIEVDDLGIPPAPEAASGQTGEVALGADVSIELLEREHIARIIARAPTMEAAARTLGIDASTLQRKRKRYGLT
ncbi:MAG TPA: sigma-54 dependent transcriptional regulator [Kofleriaceae bacterium]|nr:sigma-54 dependent transcriptional regulator [Kofleriaceae bacterium]